MALSREQFQQLRDKGLTVDQIIAFERGETPKEMAKQKAVKQEMAGNQFQQEEPKGFLGKARDFVTGFIGGGEVAKGAGMALAAPEVQSGLESEQRETEGLQSKILETIRKNKAEGKDTSRLEKTLKQSQGVAAQQQDMGTDFTEAMPTSKQVIGSAARLGATFAAPALAKGAGAVTGATTAKTFTSGAIRGGIAGAGTGAIEGGIQGAGLAAEKNLGGAEMALAGGAGALGGAALGGALGAIGGGFLARRRGQLDPQMMMDKITPRADQLSESSYNKLLEQGRVTPGTATEPARIKLSKEEVRIAHKFKELWTNNPVQNVINTNQKIADLDGEVEKLLKKDNFRFDPQSLRAQLEDAMSQVDDLTLDEKRLSAAKKKLIDGFMASLDDNDALSLWRARKEYDSLVSRAFQGTPTTKKLVEKTLRTAAQDFLKVTNPKYKDLMSDMTGLFDLRDLIGIIAKKERGLSAVSAWAKANPIASRVVIDGALLGGGWWALNKISGSGQSSHD